MKIKLAPMDNLQAGFTLRSCERCGKAIAHYDPDYVVIGLQVWHEECLIEKLQLPVGITIELSGRGPFMADGEGKCPLTSLFTPGLGGQGERNPLDGVYERPPVVTFAGDS